MKFGSTKNFFIFICGLTAVLVLINLIGLANFFRVDLTKDGKFTLSKASKETVKTLKDTLTVSAYFTEDLPPPYAQNARYVKDLLEEYYSASVGNFAYEFVDPTSFETQEDKDKKKNLQRNIFGQLVREPTAIEQELSGLGIQPVEIRVIEDDKQQTKRAYMGIVVRYQEKYETIPLVQDLSDLEITLTSLIRKLTRDKRPILGVIKNAALSSRFEQFIKMMGNEAEVKDISFIDGQDIDSSIDALMVLGSGDHFGEDGAKKINNFLALGKNASFFMDIYNVQPNNFSAAAENPRSTAYAVIDLLKTYGLEISSDIVADANCASINMQEQRGGFNFNVPIRYPFIPEIKNLSFESSISKGLSGVLLPFASALKIEKKENIATLVLGYSSKNSWLEKDPLNLDPRQNWSAQNIAPAGPYPLLVEARGKLPGANAESRIIVVGTSAFLWTDFLVPANQALASNMIDWMLADSSILEMKTKTFSDVPLNVDISDATRQLVKYFNIVGVPLLLIIYGIFRWRLREMNRRSIKI